MDSSDPTLDESCESGDERASEEGACLWVVGTPIGNLEDISLRALRILKSCWAVAAEDTRHARKIFTRYDIPRPQRWISYREENREAAARDILSVLGEGHAVAVVTDAGMPTISDPGQYLVHCCHQAGFRVAPVPGPSAMVTAVACSGLPSQRLAFEGFLSRRASHRRAHLAQLVREPRTMVFYEAPSRVPATLAELRDTMGASRQACVTRELTKRFEEIRVGDLDALVQWASSTTMRGEFTIVVEGLAPGDKPQGLADDDESEAVDPRHLLAAAMERGLTRREAAREVSHATGIPSRDLYRMGLDATAGEPQPEA